MTDTLADIVRFASTAYTILIFARVVFSWFNPAPGNPMVDIVYRLTDPVLGFFHRFIPPIGGLDITPIFILFGIQLLERLLLQMIYGL